MGPVGLVVITGIDGLAPYIQMKSGQLIENGEWYI